MRKQNNILRLFIHLVALAVFIGGVTLSPALAQAGAPSWTYTSSPNTVRELHTATLLQSGKVLVAGGNDGTVSFGSHSVNIVNSAELYDPNTDMWIRTGNLSDAREFHTATLLRNGRVLVVGGFNNCGQSTCRLNSAELYDPDTGMWSATGNLNIARQGHTATLLPDGRVLVAGGANVSGDLSSAELYNPVTGTWSGTGGLITPRVIHAAALLPNGRVLVAGGEGLASDSRTRIGIASAEIYDPATGSWSSTGNLNTARALPTATLLLNGKVLIAGGSVVNIAIFDSAELYDPASETWTITGNLKNARTFHTATLLPNGKVLVAGGYISLFRDDDEYPISSSAELYDPAAAAWSTVANLNTLRIAHTATLLSNGKVLVAGGSSQNTAELYEPGSNQIDNAQFFVQQHYRDFLNREPDTDGLAFWTSNISGCGIETRCIEAKRVDTSAAYFLSIEFQETGYLVYRTYKAAYGNLPDAPVPIKFAEFLPDTQQIGQGVIVNQPGWEQLLENNKQSFFSNFVQRSRFSSAFRTSITPDQFVDQLFFNAGVTPSESDRALAINEFGGAANTSDTAARARALRRIAENSTLAQQEFNRAFVLMQYFGYLRRNPNDLPDNSFAGYNFWLGKLNQFNGDYIQAEMVKAFLVSTEYRQRFSL